MTEPKSTKIDSYTFHILDDPKSAGPSDGAEETVDSPRTRERRVKSVAPPVPPLRREVPEHYDLPEDVERQNSGTRASGEEIQTRPNYSNGLPVLIEVTRPDWSTNIEGFKMGARVGNIVTGFADEFALEALSADPKVIRVDFSRESGGEELDVTLSTVGASNVQSSAIPENGENAIVGVIDSGLDVLHEAFQDANGQTRIIAYWDQYDDSGPAPKDIYGNSLGGTHYTAADINRMIANSRAEMDLTSASHGTHVTSIAAGRKVGQFSGGIAPQAKIIFVRAKIDTPIGDSRSIGYSMAHVSALSFLDKVAQEEGLPLSVNVSLGMNGGAHDGSSTLEAAFDNFSSNGRTPGRVIVKSAGNEGEKARHARFEIGEGQTITLDWSSKSTPRYDDVLEAWYNSSDHLEFRLISGDGYYSTETISLQNPRTTDAFPNGNKYSMALDTLFRDNGDTRLSIRITDPTGRIVPGVWGLEVKAVNAVSGDSVDVWIERANGDPIQFLNHIEINGTVTVPGTANSVITVAATDKTSNAVQGFSSRGSTRNGSMRPDLSAPGLNINAAHQGTKSGIVAMPGTSMAAPHVTGAVALLLSQQNKNNSQLNSNQVRTALRLSANGFNGRWNSARGWGSLNIEKLLRVFSG